MLQPREKYKITVQIQPREKYKICNYPDSAAEELQNSILIQPAEIASVARWGWVRLDNK
jgi:hypothetical protein